ncbi:hypothetical protein HK099_000085 [Clydaea vesicula]|uniref:Adenosine kinase n=1 Tax=Clydaea vesicula TaxID=447962 RepID=A0AAD5U7N9_9FUNG|nr:hypothetical protein HK099_000085 [Clydaea vesicula]KAJ3386985.1 hypothetical protein HDU92_002184 [Lobulomyces angularis]
MSDHFFLGIGNPLLDISAVVKPELLAKYDLKANDAILAEEKHKPLYDELVRDYNVEYVAGGAAQNAMRGAQWLLPENSTIYIGAAGKDDQAIQLVAAAKKDGLETKYMEVHKPTGRCAVLITGISRSLVTDLLAANEYKIEHLKSPEIWACVEKAKYFYVGGYFLTVSPDSALHLAKHAAQTNKHFMMNLSAPFIPQFFKKQVDDLEEYWDVLFGNEAEAISYADSHDLKTHNITEIALHISKLPKKNVSRSRMVVFTQGAHSTIVVKDGKVHEFPVIPIDTKDIVDTNGAGDAYCGGFLSQYVQGKSIETCAKAGNYVANVVIQRNGPTYPSEAHSFKE